MIEIVRPQPALVPALTEFFRLIDRPEIKEVFHPHDFTSSEAQRLCHYQGKDEYYLILRDQTVLGYGLLRGWDEGYEIPSLGICIHPQMKGKGLGLALMHHLVAAARVRGAPSMILKVKKDNREAIKLYLKLGFVLAEHDNQYLKGTLNLSSLRK